MSLDILFDYIRMVGYATVFLTTIFLVKQKRINNVLAYGNIIFVICALSYLVYINILEPFWNNFIASTQDIFITPAIILWAIFYLYYFIKK